jgi:hypothetical protein
LNELAWILAHRVEHSELNLSSQNISHKLGGIATVLEGLQAQVADVFSKERLPDASAAEEAVRSAKVSEAKALAAADSQPQQSATETAAHERKAIRGKRFQACARDGKVFLIYRRRGDLPVWIGFELDFSASANSNPVPIYLNSKAGAELFVYGD